MFDQSMYGSLLRYHRMKAGYRKGEEFIADLAKIGLDTPVATLYRIERGERMAPYSFIAGANLLLFGDVNSSTLTGPCLPEGWSNPEESDAIMRVLKANGALENRRQQSEADGEFRRYEEIMSSEVTSYDFEVFANANSSDDELRMTVRYGSDIICDPLYASEFIETYLISCPEDVERSIVSFIRSREYDLSGKELYDLVEHGKRAMRGPLAEYGLLDPKD